MIINKAERSVALVQIVEKILPSDQVVPGKLFDLMIKLNYKELRVQSHGLNCSGQGTNLALVLNFRQFMR